MPTTIKLKNSVTTTNAPSSLAQGEVAINITDKKVWVGNAATTPIQLLGDGGSVNFTTVDTTNLQVTNIKAKDGTASASIANSTGAFTVAAAFAANGGATLGDASGDALTINSSAVSIPNGLNFDSNTLVIDAANNRVGIGTSSPSYQLTVSQATTGYIFAVTDGTSTFGVANQGGSSLIGTITNHPLRFGTNDNERMRITSAGDVLINGTSNTFYGNSPKLTVVGGASPLVVSNGDNSGTFIRFDTGAANGIITINANARSGSYPPLAFQTADTERMRIDSSGNVGIGTSSPSKLLDVAGNAAVTGTGVLSLQRPIVPVFGQGTPQLVFQYYTTGTTYTTGAQIQGLADGSWSSTSAPTNMLFYTCPSASTTIAERMRITSNGRLLVGTTTENTSGGVLQVSNGITFPATQSASSDANTLDDYEEGTFTPTIRGSGTAGTVTYAANGQIGRYTKIGDTVKFNIYIAWTNWTGSPSGDVWVAGLPFTSVVSTNSFTAVSVYMDGAYTLSANNVLQGYINQGVSYVLLSQYAVGGGNATPIGYDTNSALMISGTYETA